jgi:hypothetical protein
MTRLEPQQEVAGELLASLGSAAEQFTATVERQVREIIEAAEERASRIESEALERARQVELRSQAYEEQVRRETAARASQMLEGLAYLDEGLNVLRELREEVAGIAETSPAEGEHRTEDEPRTAEQEWLEQSHEPDEGSADPTAGESAEPPTEEEATPRWPEESVGEEGEASSSSNPVAAAIEGDAQAAEAAAPVRPGRVQNGALSTSATSEEERSELNGMIRGQIVRMYEQGKSRDEVERLLMRFKLGESYIGMLDEVYGREEPAQAPRKRRRFRRRRR